MLWKIFWETAWARCKWLFWLSKQKYILSCLWVCSITGLNRRSSCREATEWTTAPLCCHVRCFITLRPWAYVVSFHHALWKTETNHNLQKVCTLWGDCGLSTQSSEASLFLFQDTSYCSTILKQRNWKVILHFLDSLKKKKSKNLTLACSYRLLFLTVTHNLHHQLQFPQ